MPWPRDLWACFWPARPLLLSVLFFLSSLQIRLSAEQWTNSEITASFYGDSYLWLALQDASSATELSVNFRTHQRDAIIFLAAGETDYCLVELRNGRLRVRVNLGSGESVMQSPRGLRLDDYVWHSVQLSRRNAQATLTVDRQYVSHLIIPGVFYQLNIIYGVYLGGLGQFRDLFLGNFVQFRGCLKNVKFNAIEANRVRNWDVLRTAYLNQSNPDDSSLQHIRWECDDEFSAKNHDPISFVQTDNFVTFPTLQIRQNGSIDLEIKTIASEGVILYNGGSPAQPDFLALDIVQGKIRFQMEKGNGPLLLESKKKINDGLWHNISCQISTAHAQLSVDGQVVTLSPRSSIQRYLDLDGTLYLGGVELSRKARLRQQGLYDRSFLGCMKDLKVNELELGFEKIVASNGIEPGCVWDYPCSRTPCIKSATCYQIGFDSFRCDCPVDKCEKDKEDMIDWGQVLKIGNFTVKEAGQHIIGQDDIRVIWNYQGESIRDSQISFQVTRPPRYGKLEVNLIPRNSDNSFTYLDIISDRVLYIHDGSERPQDQFELTIQIPTTMGNLTRNLLITVSINPENDAPKIVFPNGPQIEIVPGTARTLTADIMRAVDPDSSSSALIFSLLVPLKIAQLRPSASAADSLSSPTGSPQPLMKQFTQADIDAGLVEIYFNGTLTDQDQAVFSITDGVHSGKEKGTLAIIPLKLNIHVVTNKGINVPINSSSLLTQNNLSFSTNAIHQNLTIFYSLINQPSFGRLELHNDAQWIPTENFTQDDINTLAVRYIHTKEAPSRDAFRVRLTALPQSGGQANVKDQVHTVQIRFLENRLKSVHLEPLVFHSPHVIVSSINLLHEQEPMPMSAEDVHYTLTRSPNYGVLQRGGSKLKNGDRFSQADVNSGLIVYSLLPAQNMDLPHRDYALFDIKASHHKNIALKSKRLFLKYDPVRSSWIVRDTVLKVKEGASTPLTSDFLSIQYGGVNQSCNFDVLTFPQHGALQTRDRKNISEFSSTDIREKLVFYTHDNSETENDAMDVVVNCNGRQQKLQFPLVVNITLLNNHRPTPTRLGPIFTVQNSTRLITNDDISLTDIDANSPIGSLQIAHRNLQNGDFFHVSDRHTPVFQFVQNDIEQGHILFRHRGPLQADSTVYISDGELFSSEKLTIQAEPFLLTSKDFYTAALNSSTSVVELSFQDLGVQTNADLKWNGLTATIHKGPKFGTASIKNQRVIYKRKDDNMDFHSDSFTILFTVNNFSSPTNVTLIPVKPMTVEKPQLVLVRENSFVQITNDILNTSHPIFEVSKLIYTMERQPSFGSVSLGPAASSEQFTQEDVNLGRVKYTHRKFSKTYRDQFVLRVEAPLASDTAIVTVNIFIVPEVLRLSYQKPLKVPEGGEARLKMSSLLKGIANADYMPLKLQMKDKPSHGKAYVEKDGELIYTHDGSETLTDVFTIITSLEKLSISTTEEIVIEIVPLNDMPPQIVVKNPVDVWIGDSGLITPENLGIIDEDSDMNIAGAVLHLNSSKIDLFVDNQKVTEFVYGQVLENRTRYTPNSWNISAIPLYASDGKMLSEGVSLPVRMLDVKLVVVRNESIEVGRNSSLVITTDELDIAAKKLSAWTNHDLGLLHFSPADLIFSITQPPKFGYVGLFQNNDGLGDLSQTSSFSQKDLLDGRVGYMQSVPVNEQSLDFFHFEVNLDQPLKKQLTNLLFSINIKSTDSAIRSHALLVPFGRSVLVKRLHLDATRFLPRNEWRKIKFVISYAPKLGSFFLDNNQLKSGSSFTQTDVNKQRVSYQHLGKESQTTSDDIVLKLQMPDKKPISIPLNITILESDSHLKVTASDTDVVRGENLTLSNTVLKTNLDNNLEKVIRYRVFKELRGGLFRLRDVPAREFTQRDVLDKIVVFAHDGSEEPRTIPVQLEVLPMDDKTAVSELVQFNIHIIPFFFRLDHHANISLLQGNFVVPLNSTYISVASNADKSRILYQVIKDPSYGKLRNSDISRAGSLKSFSQLDLDKGRIFYEQTNLDYFEDHFAFDIILTKREEDLALRNKSIFVTVLPLAKIESAVVALGHSIALGPNLLDALALKTKTKSEPVFEIISGPTFGSLSYAGTNSAPVTNLTQSDIMEKKVIYKAPPDGSNATSDLVEFILKGSSEVQIARGSLFIKLKNLPQQPIKIVTNDDLLIALIITGVIVSAIIAFVILCVRIRSQKKRRKRSVSHHAHLSPLFQPKGRTGDSPDETVDLAPSTVPNCKVIPLRKAGKNFRSPETELHHLDAYREDLYGTPGNGYVSRTETTPVLSKNQYWV